MRFKKFFAELKRRKVYRVVIAYAVVSWLLIQIATQVFPFLQIPDWTIRLVILVLVLGFPVAALLAWAFDLTPEGVIRTEDAPVSQAGVPRLPQLAISAKSIAVLPFENLSDNQENEYFADGIQDDILASLSQISDLKVISRTSVRQYRTGTRNLREIGHELGVAHILEGTVRRAGNRVRVNVQLINAATDAHVWVDSFDRELDDLFRLQSELAEQITRALRANLSPQEMASLRIHATANLEAYENYLRARDLFRWSGAGDPRENGERALRCLDRSILLDPNFAAAHALASRWHAELYWFGQDRSCARLDKVKAAAEAALRVKPDLAEAQIALAYYHYFGFREYEKARTQLELALESTPNDAEIYDAFGAVSRRQGRWAESLTHFEKARELDPRNPSVLWNLAETNALLGRHAAAEQAIAQGLEVNPDAHLFPLLRATIPLRERGETAPLRASLEKIPREFDPGGGVTLVGIRMALLERNYVEADRLLRAAPHDRFNDTGLGGVAGVLDGYSFPRRWLEGVIARGRGDEDGARAAFSATLDKVQADVACCPDDPKALTMQALLQAALGNREDAIGGAEAALALLPVEGDAYDGPVIATNAAAVFAELGEHERALDLLGSVQGRPMGPTPGLLAIEPQWDPLRADDRFAKLLAASA